MINKYTNPCSRCGKERILSRKWKEKIPTFSGAVLEVTRTENICPDPECQKIVEQKLADEKRKRDKINQDRKDRLEKTQADKLRLKAAQRKLNE